MKKRIRLDEVTLMRCILAVLIVFMHSFTCYNGSWREPDGFVDIPLYRWLSRITFSFALEGFVFISGYLFAYQSIVLNRSERILSKLKRLVLPSIIFSAAYFAIFYQYKGVGNMLYNIINGCGHLWYLPMLFWCFVGAMILERISIKDTIKIIILLGLYFLPMISLPLQLTPAKSFLLYFYAGYVLFKYRDSIISSITLKHLLLGWILFLSIFTIFRPLQDILICNNDSPIIYKLFLLTASKMSNLLYSSIGVIVFYSTAVYYLKNHELKQSTIKLSSVCFGIYIIHQFVLQLLYYKTSFPIIVGPYSLPWLGFVITIILAYFLSAMAIRTKWGKFLIG